VATGARFVRCLALDLLLYNSGVQGVLNANATSLAMMTLLGRREDSRGPFRECKNAWNHPEFGLSSFRAFLWRGFIGYVFTLTSPTCRTRSRPVRKAS
jgi:hypothetical protein